jgi:putative Ca2+/H+ antiporter (TMEM165/GDT1 family)
MSTPDGSEAEGTMHGFVQAFSMIIVSEIGDKTFLIAAILAMRHPRLLVFAGAFGSLVVMSILSAAMGHVLPTLIPKRWTQLAAGVLFLIFGAKLFLEGKEMPSGNEKVLEEMREAEEEINGDAAEHDGTGRVSANGDVIPLEEIEAGGPAVGNGHARGDKPKPLSRVFDGTRNLCSFLFGPVFVQAFVLTFLGEWGDRSQIATIMLAAAHVRETHSSCAARLWLTVIDAERIRCCAWNDRRAYVLYRTRRYGWPLYIYKSLCKTWYASLPPLPPCATELTPSFLSHLRRSSVIPLLRPHLSL